MRAVIRSRPKRSRSRTCRKRYSRRSSIIGGAARLPRFVFRGIRRSPAAGLECRRPHSSVGQSSGLIIRRSLVRVQVGAFHSNRQIDTAPLPWWTSRRRPRNCGRRGPAGMDGSRSCGPCALSPRSGGAQRRPLHAVVRQPLSMGHRTSAPSPVCRTGSGCTLARSAPVASPSPGRSARRSPRQAWSPDPST